MTPLFVFQDGLARMYLDDSKLPCIGERKEDFHYLAMHQINNYNILDLLFFQCFSMFVFL